MRKLYRILIKILFFFWFVSINLGFAKQLSFSTKRKKLPKNRLDQS